MPENDYAARAEQYQKAEERLNSKGKVERKNYGPLGSGWIVKLDKATVDDTLIEDLNQLDRITELHLPGATITDSQLESILSSKLGVFLNVVDVSGTNITDAALKPLVTLAYLQKVNISGTKVSDAFVKEMLAKRKASTGIPSQCKNVAFTK
jgi:hypothetical protein